MKAFAHFNAASVEEAVSLLQRYDGKAQVIAGGTDLLGKMKDRILPGYPEALVNIKTIPGLDGITEKDGFLKIGALAILEDIAHHPVVRDKYSALAQAARRTASPHLREMGTLGGNITQDIRCWYYRNPNNRFPCLRKGGGRCYALAGDNRYHSIFGGSVPDGCVAVHPSDTAPALVALDAKVLTSRRAIPIEEFFQVGVAKTTVLDDHEVVTGVDIPQPASDSKSAFIKFAFRKSIDFPIVNCAALVQIQGGKVAKARICLNAVFLKPYRAVAAEEAIKGKKLNQANADKAGEAALAEAKPLSHNAYMVTTAKTLVSRALLECSG